VDLGTRPEARPIIGRAFDLAVWWSRKEIRPFSDGKLRPVSRWLCVSAINPLDAAIHADARPRSVGVVAGDEVVRQRVIRALARDGHLISSQASTCDELETQDCAVEAVVIASVSSAGEQVSAIHAAKARIPDARIVIVGTAGPNGVHKAFEAGADGFVLERNLDGAVGPTVRAVCVGQVVVPPVMRATVVRPALTHREKQTLALLVHGLTNAEIASRLFLAESTVKCHLTAIFSKLGVHSRSEAVARALDSHESGWDWRAWRQPLDGARLEARR
jgi:DNA-binding NarL/FixJ family response regulator